MYMLPVRLIVRESVRGAFGECACERVAKGDGADLFGIVSTLIRGFESKGH